jgi:hypothetical protein
VDRDAEVGAGLHRPVSCLLRSSPREVGGRVLLDPAWEGVKVSSRQPSFERTEMPAPCNADTPSAQSFVQARDVDAQLDGVGVYLTNEAFLYRVVGLVAGGMDEIVELEDCYGLDVVRVPMRDLSARRLRVVTPTPG